MWAWGARRAVCWKSELVLIMLLHKLYQNEVAHLIDIHIPIHRKIASNCYKLAAASHADCSPNHRTLSATRLTDTWRQVTLVASPVHIQSIVAFKLESWRVRKNNCVLLPLNPSVVVLSTNWYPRFAPIPKSFTLQRIVRLLTGKSSGTGLRPSWAVPIVTTCCLNRRTVFLLTSTALTPVCLYLNVWPTLAVCDNALGSS